MAACDYGLTWGGHSQALGSGLDSLMRKGLLTDCIVCVSGPNRAGLQTGSIKAHRSVLAATSRWFEHAFSLCGDNPVILLKDVCFEDLKSVIRY